jgi:3-phenylpropionate/trans-cinnamate dioxygenase ferredoxin subunit
MTEVEVEIGPLAEGESRSVRLGYGRYVLVSRVEGALRAIDDVCNHGGCKLSDGWREGRTVVCPCHALAFDLADGRLATPTPLAGDQPAYRVVEEGPTVRVTLPDGPPSGGVA